MPTATIRQLEHLLRQVFLTDVPDSTSVIKPKIQLLDDSPIKSNSYAIQYALRQSLKTDIADMMGIDIIK